jgi:class 3 adenylate cyclase/DNA-binding CsgD family transcriptional regulator/tetratricopeptide (TPR) repeat protein
VAELPTGTVTFLFSDIQGSTQLLKDVGRERYGEVLARHNELLRDAYVEVGGLEIDRQGDAFFAVFPSAAAAIRAAVAGQRALAKEPWPDHVVVRVRMGVHTGEASLSSDGGYVGFAVHKASRIGDAGHGGQILVSSTTTALVEHELSAEFELRDLGQNRLDGLDRPERLYQLVVDGLADVFPPLETRYTPAAAGANGLPLLEREAELAALRAMIEVARTGNGRLVAIEGPAGMGKSRLVGETRELAATAGMRVLSARGGELEHDFSYGVVRQLFEPVLALSPIAEREELLGGAAALAAPLFDERALTGGMSADGSFSTLHGLFWLAANLASRQPLLLAVDDLHWSDAASLRWLGYLARRLEGQPLLVVAGTRPSEQATEQALVAEILADPGAVVVRPQALTLHAATSMIRETLERDVDVEFADACHEATIGNPLLLRSLLDALASEGIAPKAKNAARVHEIGPEAVSRSVHLRLSRLPDEATRLARAVAVLGDDVRLADAAELADLDRDLSAHTAATLTRNGILRLERALSFVHPVVRAAVYSDLNPSERERAHCRAAGLLSDAGATTEKVAAHLLLTAPGTQEIAVPVLRDAAERSLAKGDPSAAGDYLRRAIEEPLDAIDRGRLLFQLGLAERLVDNPLAAEHLREAHDLTDDVLARGEIALELGRTLFFSMWVEEAVGVLEGAIASVGDQNMDLRRRLEAGLLSVTLLFPPLYPLAVQQLERVRTLPLGDDLGSRTLLALLSLEDMRSLSAPLEVCVANAERAVAGGALFAQDNAAFAFSTVTLTTADRFDVAQAIFDDAFADARVRGSVSAFAIASIFRGYLQIFTGELAEAESDLQNGLRASEQHGLMTGVAYALAFLADAQMQRGDLEGAAASLGKLGALPEAARDHWYYYDARGRLRHLQGRYREALAEYDATRRQFEAVGGKNPALVAWRSQAALAHLQLGEQDAARVLAAEEVEVARQWGASRALAKALRVQGMVEGGKQGLPLLREAVDLLEGSRATLERARGLLELGSALRRSNQRSEAREFLRQAVELAHAGESPALAERARAELMATGARPRRIALSGLESLTPSERRVASMAAKEMTNRDIAQALFVTPKTVEVHLSSVYRKLGIASRAQLSDVLGAMEGSGFEAPTAPALG